MFIVTGGSSGIGKALAQALAYRGKDVLIVGRREHLLQEAAAQSSKINYFCTDISTNQGIDECAEYCKSIPRIEGLVNNAGIIEPIALLQNMQAEAWNQALNTNLNASLFLPQKLYSQLAGGRVLNIGTGAAYFPIKGWSAYCVTKAALSMLTRCWQVESESVAFASVMPGIIDTNMQAIARTDSNIDQERVAYYRRLKDLNRLISVETVAAFLTWILLDVDSEVFSAQEWDIYETSHHEAWLKSPHQVPDKDI